MSIVDATAMRDMEVRNREMEIAFNREKIRSDDPNMMGNRILPKPPINTGMIMKKIMKIPWREIALLYC